MFVGRKEGISGVFQPRVSPSRARANTMSLMMSLLGLRGAWCMGTVDDSQGVPDKSGNGANLTTSGTNNFGLAGLVPYVYFDAGGQQLYDTDAALLDITGTETFIESGYRGLTMGLWLKDVDLATAQTWFAKWKITGSNDRSYALRSTAAQKFRFYVSNTGTDEFYAESTDVYPDNWCFIVGRFDPSTEVAIFVNGVKTVNTTSIPASIYSSAANLSFGSMHTPADEPVQDGYVADAFLCGAYLPDAVIQTLYHESKGMFPYA